MNLRWGCLAFLVGLPALALAPEASAQEAPPTGDAEAAESESLAASEENGTPGIGRARIGIGVGLDLVGGNLTGTSLRSADLPQSPFSFAPAPLSFTSIHMPIWIGDHLRIEPEIGYGRTSRELKIIEGIGEPDASTTSMSSAFRVGAGVAWAFAVGADTFGYVGPKMGLILRKDEQEFREERDISSVTISSTDLFLGAAVGGEAFLTSAFSLGVEGEFLWVSEGTPRIRAKPDFEMGVMPGTLEGTQLLTRARLFGRLYFR